MTNAEAIKIINQYDCNFYWTDGEKIPTEDLIEAFELAVKALDAQTPRVLTLEEVEDALDTVVWVDRPQIRNSSLEFALLAIYSRKREKTALYFIDGEKTTWRYSDYGRTWRCWSSRPTDEQRESVKWDDCREKVTEHETD